MIKKKKGQMLHENMLLFGIITVIIMALSYIGLNYLYSSHRINRADDVVKSLAITANTVHNLGRGSKETVLVYIPPGVEKTNVSGSDIIMTLVDGNIVSSSGVEISSKLIGGIPKLQGYYYIPIRAITDEIVIIGNAAFIVNIVPDCIGVNMMPINITIEGDGFQQGYNVFVLWPGGQLVEIDPSLIFIPNINNLVFTATNTNFFSNPNPPPFKIYVQNLQGEFSNELEFDVKPSINQC